MNSFIFLLKIKSQNGIENVQKMIFRRDWDKFWKKIAFLENYWENNCNRVKKSSKNEKYSENFIPSFAFFSLRTVCKF